MIKPVSGLCNMRCRYCFYCDVIKNRTDDVLKMMSDETLEVVLRRAFEYDADALTFAFQGGEPTLAGVEYYEKFTALADKYNVNGIPIEYAIQTNGLELDDAMLELFKKRRFLVGISLDGPSQLHDSLRIDAGGNGTFSRVSKSIGRLKAAGVDFNILCVAENYVAKNAASVYRYFRSKGYRFIQFIPYISAFGTERDEYAPTAERYAAFLKTAFDLYYEDYLRGNFTSVRQFDNYVLLAAGQCAECCGMNGGCAISPIVESDGSVYPCDFYVVDRWRLGNLHEHSFSALMHSSRAAEFIKLSEKLPEECAKCSFYGLCRGGCRRFRDTDIENSPDGGFKKNLWCEAYKTFFEYAAPKIFRMAEEYKQSIMPR